MFVVETGEKYGQDFNSFIGPHRGGHFRGFRGPAPRMGRGGNRWHDNAMRGRPPMPRFGNSPRFERPARFGSPQRFNGPPRFNGARGDGSNRFNVPRFEGHPRFDASPMFRRGAPFRGGPGMRPRFQGFMPAGVVQPLLSQPCPPWYDNNDMENEEEMQSEGSESTGIGVPSLLDHRCSPLTGNNQLQNEESVHESSLEDSNKRGDIAVTSASESERKITSLPTDNNVTTSNSDTEKRVRKSRYSNVPPESAEQQATAESADSSTVTADSTNAETVKTDAV